MKKFLTICMVVILSLCTAQTYAYTVKVTNKTNKVAVIRKVHFGSLFCSDDNNITLHPGEFYESKGKLGFSGCDLVDMSGYVAEPERLTDAETAQRLLEEAAYDKGLGPKPRDLTINYVEIQPMTKYQHAQSTQWEITEDAKKNPLDPHEKSIYRFSPIYT